MHALFSKQVLKKSFLVFLSFAVIFCSMSTIARAEWPRKPIQIIIPWPPSGDTATTIVTAMLSELEDELGVPVKIFNKVGGAGVIGFNEMARSRPDGYTFGIGPIGPSILQVLLGNAPYKTSDLMPLSVLYFNSTAVTARADAPFSNLKELAEYAQTNQIRLGIGGVGDVRYIMTENIAKEGNFEWKAITFQDLSPLVLLQNSADVMSGPAAPLKDYVENKEVKIIAMLLPERSTAFPDVPTVSEQGFGSSLAVWAGLYAPKGTPPKVAEKFRAAFVKVFKSEKLTQMMTKMGVIPVGSTTEEASKRFNEEVLLYTEIVKELELGK